jgi:NADH:ubiquinone oxidoreductase subunit E
MEIEKIDLDGEIGRTTGPHLSVHDRKKGLLIPLLHRIQEEYGYLPGELLERLSMKLELPLSEMYSVASFYNQFYFAPRGRKIVRVCMGTACHVRGAGKLLDNLQQRFNVEIGETTEDMAMTLETVGCVGCCGLAPVITVNEDILGEVGSKNLELLLESIEED